MFKFLKSLINKKAFAPWVKVKYNGVMYNDESDPRYIEYIKAKYDYWGQWSIAQGALIRTRFDIKDEPHWKDFI